MLKLTLCNGHELTSTNAPCDVYERVSGHRCHLGAFEPGVVDVFVSDTDLIITTEGFVPVVRCRICPVARRGIIIAEHLDG